MYGFLALLVWGYMTVWFGIAVVQKRNDLADVAWGLGFVLLAWASWFMGTGHLLAAAVNVLVTIWGVRLAWHIHRRHQGRPEDFRYAAWRKEWGGLAFAAIVRTNFPPSRRAHVLHRVAGTRSESFVVGSEECVCRDRVWRVVHWFCI